MKQSQYQRLKAFLCPVGGTDLSHGSVCHHLTEAEL